MYAVIQKSKKNKNNFIDKNYNFYTKMSKWLSNNYAKEVFKKISFLGDNYVSRNRRITPYNIFVFSRRTSRWHPTVATFTHDLCFITITLAFIIIIMLVFVSITAHGTCGGVLRQMMNEFLSSKVAAVVAVVIRITRTLYILQTNLLL